MTKPRRGLLYDKNNEGGLMGEHEHEYVSECCEALPLGGEVAPTPYSEKVPGSLYVVGICQECHDPIPFICIECEEDGRS